MSDDFSNHTAGLDSPAANAISVTPSDAADLAKSTRALFVGGAGDVAVTMVGGSSVTFAAVAAGAILPIRVSRVLATGTTATGIVGLY